MKKNCFLLLEPRKRVSGVGAGLYGVLGVGEHILLLDILFVVVMHTKYFNILCEKPILFGLSPSPSLPPFSLMLSPGHSLAPTASSLSLSLTYN